MRRIVVGLAAALLLGGSAIASIPSACADTFIKGLKVSHFVRVGPGWSVGLVTVTAGGGKVRHDEDYMAETSIKVVPTSWVGTVPTTLWVDGGVVDHPTDGRLRTVRAAGFAPEAFRPGTQWVVQVRDADAWMPNHPLPVVGNSVRIPRLAADDVDGGDPKVVNLDALPLDGRHGGRVDLPAPSGLTGAKPHPARGRQSAPGYGCFRLPMTVPAASSATTRSTSEPAGSGGDTKATHGTGLSRPKVGTTTGDWPASSIRTVAASSSASPDSSRPEPGAHDRQSISV